MSSQLKRDGSAFIGRKKDNEAMEKMVVRRATLP
jgi:hypothetical protein